MEKAKCDALIAVAKSVLNAGQQDDVTQLLSRGDTGSLGIARECLVTGIERTLERRLITEEQASEYQRDVALCCT